MYGIQSLNLLGASSPNTIEANVENCEFQKLCTVWRWHCLAHNLEIEVILEACECVM